MDPLVFLAGLACGVVLAVCAIVGLCAWVWGTTETQDHEWDD